MKLQPAAASSSVTRTFDASLHVVCRSPLLVRDVGTEQVIMKHCIQLPVPMWREVMTLMGPKYGLLARDTYDSL